MWLEDFEKAPDWQGFEWAECGLEKMEELEVAPLSGGWKCRGKCGKVLELNEANFHLTPYWKVICKLCANEKRQKTVSRLFKTCNGGCGKVLRENEENFYRSKVAKRKFMIICKLCYDVRFGPCVPICFQRCTGACGQTLKLCADFFSLNRKARTGFGSKCKVCVNEEHKARRRHV